MGVKLSFLLCLLLVYINFSESKGKLVELDDRNWSDIASGEWMVEFFAPWCPACKALGPVWKEFSEWSEDLGVNVGHADVTNNPGLSGRFMITALPTIYHVKDGVFRQYRGSRDKESFISFIEDKKWNSIEPIPSWKSPQSVQMSAVSYFFKLSMTLRNIHSRIVDDFGVPHWVSYIIFALATIVLGAILGLIVVCVIDIIFPQKLPEIPLISSQKDKTEGEEEDDKITEEEDLDEDDDIVLDDTVSSTTKETGKSTDVRKRNIGSEAPVEEDQDKVD